jgi:toxin-antitoxin system PIN domain toxin
MLSIVDANVLLHAVNSDSPQHEAARGWLADALGRRDAVGLAWTVLLAFLRVSTHPAVFRRPLTPEEAISTVRAWLGSPAVAIVEPGPRHLSVLAGLLAEAGTAGNLVNDAHLAALAIESGAQLVSFDTGFARFGDVRWSRPALG